MVARSIYISDVNKVPLVGSGAVDLTINIYAYAGKNFPLAKAGYNYFMVANSTHEEAVASWNQLFKEFPEFTEQFTKANQKVLAAYTNVSARTITSKQPILKLADFQGKKISAAGKVQCDMLAAAGATPVNLPSGEAFDALDKGVIDGTFGSSELNVRYKMYEVAKNCAIFFDGAVVSIGLHINLDKWNSLPSSVQDVLVQVANDWVPLSIKNNYKLDEASFDVLRKQGTTVNPPITSKEEFRALAKKVTAPTYQAMVKEAESLGYANARKIFDRWCELVNHEP